MTPSFRFGGVASTLKSTLCILCLGVGPALFAQVEPFFIKACPLWQHVDWRKGESPFPFQLSQEQVKRTIDEVVAAMNDPGFLRQALADRNAQVMANMIRHRVATICLRSLGSKPNPFASQWFLAEGICEFVRATCSYDHSDRERNQRASVQIDHATFKYIYSEEKPSAVCWGIAVCVRDLSRAAGLDCRFVNVNFRGFGSQPPKQSDRNHGIVVFTFLDGIQVPADVSSNICDFQNNHKPNPTHKVNSWNVLPRTPEAWELFLATFNPDLGQDLDISGEKQNVVRFLTLSFGEWAQHDTSNLTLLEKWLASKESG